MRALKKKISITLDEDLLEKIKGMAEDCDRSLSQYINFVLKTRLLLQEEPVQVSKSGEPFYSPATSGSSEGELSKKQAPAEAFILTEGCIENG